MPRLRRTFFRCSSTVRGLGGAARPRRVNDKRCTQLQGCVALVPSHFEGSLATAVLVLVLADAVHAAVAETAIAEVQVGTAIDLGPTIPRGATVVSVELYAKRGADVTTNTGDWHACQTSGLFRCDPIPAGFAQPVVATSDRGTTYQYRIVPNGGAGALRARIVVTYR